MTRSRVEQRDHLMTSLGMLADPIRRLIENVETQRHTIPFVRSQFMRDRQQFHREIEAFCHVENHYFGAECDVVLREAKGLNYFLDICQSPEKPVEVIKSKFEAHLRAAQAAIRAIPCEDPSTILPSDSPFQTYARLRAVCAGVGMRLDLLDPYLSAEVFHRYLADVSSAVMIQVVTSEKVMQGRDTGRRDRIVAVSEMIAAERKDKYRYLVSSQQHDRHCRADDQILHLGGSLAHAAMKSPYTLAQLDPAQSNHAFLDDIIASAVEWYGPTTPNHRRA